MDFGCVPSFIHDFYNFFFQIKKILILTPFNNYWILFTRWVTGSLVLNEMSYPKISVLISVKLIKIRHLIKKKIS